MLKIKDLKAQIEDNQILKGINLEINAGEVHAIMGPNGSGKSTLSRLCLQPMSGQSIWQDFGMKKSDLKHHCKLNVLRAGFKIQRLRFSEI